MASAMTPGLDRMNVPSDSHCSTRQLETSQREELAQAASMATRLGIGPPGSAPSQSVRRTCPNVTGAQCTVDRVPVTPPSSKMSTALADMRCAR